MADLLNPTPDFVAKVPNPKYTSTNSSVAQFVPIYTPPIGTSETKGIVKLSDAIDSQLSAVSGTTAATPFAVNSVYKEALNKLDMKLSTVQSVSGMVHFLGGISGSLVGTASAAQKLVNASNVAYSQGNYSRFVYFSNGVPVSAGTSIGALTRPVFLSAGVITPISYSINKNILSTAMLTDTRYTLKSQSTNLIFTQTIHNDNGTLSTTSTTISNVGITYTLSMTSDGNNIVLKNSAGLSTTQVPAGLTSEEKNRLNKNVQYDNVYAVLTQLSGATTWALIIDRFLKPPTTSDYYDGQNIIKVWKCDSTGANIFSSTALASSPWGSQDMSQIRKVIINTLLEVHHFAYWFKGFTNLIEIDGFENVQNLANCSWDHCFDGCMNLEVIDFTNKKLSHTINMNYTFYNCQKLIELDLSMLPSDVKINLNSTFENCYKLKRIYVADDFAPTGTSGTNTFKNCYNLVSVSGSWFVTKTYLNADWFIPEGYLTKISQKGVNSFDAMVDIHTNTWRKTNGLTIPSVYNDLPEDIEDFSLALAEKYPPKLFDVIASPEFNSADEIITYSNYCIQTAPRAKFSDFKPSTTNEYAEDDVLGAHGLYCYGEVPNDIIKLAVHVTVK